MSLCLTRLRIEQLRRFRQPFELSGLDAGLNIIAAPNEAGKSTLVRAIRAAFFERHRSSAVDDLRPWGEGSGAAPSIELDFELDGQPYRLAKSFLAKKRCVLRIGERALDGAQAEEHLAQLFGFGFANKGASKPEHWGIPGLLWVEQGSGQDLDIGPARDHLHDALRGQAEAGAAAMAATGGDALLARLQLQRGDLLTGTGKPRGAYAEAIGAIAELQGLLQQLDVRIAAYRGQVDELATLRAQHRIDEQEQPWEGLRQALADARARHEALQASQGQLRADRTRLEQIDETRRLLAASLDAMARQASDAGARDEALSRAAQELHEADAALASVQQKADAARARAVAAAERLRQARLVDSRKGLHKQWQDAQAEASQAQTNLQRAANCQQELEALRASHAQAPSIEQAQLQKLQKLEQAVREADLLRQALAARLCFALAPDDSVELEAGGVRRRLQGDGEQLLDGPAVVHLAQGGTLTIIPGGEDLARRAQAHDAAVHALGLALQSLGVADVTQAQSRLSEVTERQARIQLAEQALAIVAPKGLDPLRRALTDAQARGATAQAALSALPAHAVGVSPAAASLDQAVAEEAEAAALDAQAATVLADARRAQGIVQGRHAAAVAEQAAARRMLDDPERQRRQAQAQDQLLAAHAEHAALAARVAQLDAVVRDAKPDILAQDMQRLQRSIEQMTRERQQRREQILLLENTLQQAEAQGLEEQRESQAGALLQTQRRHDELQRRAQALDLLCRKIEEKRQATLARLQAPLHARLSHYLPLLMPGANLRVGADLSPERLVRAEPGGTTEAGQLRELSFGAREQLSLLSRFAYADLLKQAGRPTLLILDDALVHSDAGRLAQMKRALFDAAVRHQVLLFTCHPEDWRDMGVAIRSLPANTGASAPGGQPPALIRGPGPIQDAP